MPDIHMCSVYINWMDRWVDRWMCGYVGGGQSENSEEGNRGKVLH
jgi:hypothetical protein